MRLKCAFILSIIAAISPVISTVITFFIEPEFIEALFSGLLIGCLVGSIFGAVALIASKGKDKMTRIFSIIPMCPAALYLILLIPVLTHK